MDRVAATPNRVLHLQIESCYFRISMESLACDAAQPMAPRRAWRLRLRHDAPAGRWLRNLRKHDIPAGGRGAAAIGGLGACGGQRLGATSWRRCMTSPEARCCHVLPSMKLVVVMPLKPVAASHHFLPPSPTTCRPLPSPVMLFIRSSCLDLAMSAKQHARSDLPGETNYYVSNVML
ncbi:unnamed protein product [Urochloa humidicola]